MPLVAVALAVLGGLVLAVRHLRQRRRTYRRLHSRSGPDGDGVGDDHDLYPSTPSGIQVKPNGMPAGDLDCNCTFDLVDYALMMQRRIVTDWQMCPAGRFVGPAAISGLRIDRSKHGSLNHQQQPSVDGPADAPEVFNRIVELLDKHKLLGGKSPGFDATTLEANAALRSIVRRDTREGDQKCLTRLAQESRIEPPTREELAKLDRRRSHKRSKDW